MDKLLTALDKVINLLQSRLNLSMRGKFKVVNELDGTKVFEGSWDECTDYVDEHTPDNSNTSEFKFNIIESE